MNVAEVILRADTSGLDKGVQSLNATEAAAKGVSKATVVMANTVEASVKKVNRFNTANVAAQFHDIGVTAAMGMSPLTIALQQGTQLAAILNSMESPVRGIGAAFKEVFNATSLLTIGLVGVVAVGFEFVNWMKVGEMVANTLAAAIQYLGPVFLGLAVAMAVVKWQTLYASIASIIGLLPTMSAAMTSVGVAAAAMWAFITAPVTLVVAAITLVAGTLAYLTGWFDRAGNAVKEYANNLVGIGRYSKQFRDDVAEEIDQLSIQRDTMNLSKPAAIEYAARQKEINKALKDFNGKYTNEQYDAIARSAGNAANEVGRIAKEVNDRQSRKNAGELARDVNDRIALLKAERDGLMKNKQTADMLIIQEQLLQQARGKDPLNPNINEKDIDKGMIARKAAQIASLKKDINKLENKDAFDNLTKGADRRINSLKEQTDAIGLTAQQADFLKAKTDLLNEAQQKNIELTPQQTEKLLLLAQQMGDATTKQRSMAEAFNFMKTTANGFFSDLRQGLQDGKTLWESFGNAVNNVINKIVDKLFESGITSLLDGLTGSGGPGASFLSTVASTLFSAKGNAFGSGGVMPFAKGGSFTNSIVNKPTMFQFANGGAMGQMGEAGPEAVMPLHRGPDGSLGVRSASNDNGGGIAVVNINNYGNAKVSTEQRQTGNGLQLDVMIDQTVSQKISQQGSETNRSLNTYQNRRLIKR